MPSLWTPACTEESILLVCRGVFVPVPALSGPCTLRHFLEQVLGMPGDYVDNRILTLLLNGLAADGLEAPLSPGARLGLSAAMPGTAGAVLRRAGRYAAMRRDITLNEHATVAANGVPFWVELRCFNAIAAEQGAHIIRRGTAVTASRLGPALRALARPLPSGLPEAPAPEAVWLAAPA